MAYKIWLFLWYFVLASFCGWVAEVGYIGMVYRKFKNPGMLNGPYCPQYGLMIALPWAALTALHWQTSFVATLFFCLISSFLVEFTFAWLLRKTTHIRLRDYSKFKWNIKGYVSVPVACLRTVKRSARTLKPVRLRPRNSHVAAPCLPQSRTPFAM